MLYVLKPGRGIKGETLALMFLTVHENWFADPANFFYEKKGWAIKKLFDWLDGKVDIQDETVEGSYLIAKFQYFLDSTFDAVETAEPIIATAVPEVEENLTAA